jgi:hypothetical protein
MFFSVVEILPVNLVQLLLSSIMIFTVFCLSHLPNQRRLSFLFIFQAIVCSMNILEGAEITRQYHLITPIFILAFGPILYFFVRNLVNAERLSLKNDLLHFLLAFIALPFTDYTQTIIALGSLSQIIYLLISVTLLTRYRVSSHAVRSDADSIQFNCLGCLRRY